MSCFIVCLVLTSSLRWRNDGTCALQKFLGDFASPPTGEAYEVKNEPVIGYDFMVLYPFPDPNLIPLYMIPWSSTITLTLTLTLSLTLILILTLTSSMHEASLNQLQQIVPEYRTWNERGHHNTTTIIRNKILDDILSTPLSSWLSLIAKTTLETLICKICRN